MTCAVLSLLVATLAEAQEAPALDIQRFDPMPQTASFTRVRDAEQSRAGTYGAALSINWGYRPLELGASGTFGRTAGVVDHLVGFDLGLEAAPVGWLSVGVGLPVLQVSALASDGEPAAVLGGSGRTVGLGDLSLSVAFAPLRQADGAPLQLSVVPFASFPTGSRGQFLGAGSTSVGLDVAVGRRLAHVRFTGQLGYRLQLGSSPLVNVAADDELRFGLGAAVPFASDFEVQLEWTGAVGVAPGDAPEGWRSQVHAPSELLLGVLWAPELPVWLRLGAGAGTSHAYGVPDVRVALTVGAARRTARTVVTGAMEQDVQ